MPAGSTSHRIAPRVLRREASGISLPVSAGPMAIAAVDGITIQEPVLAMHEIQGNVIPGFGTRHLELIGLRVSGSPDVARRWMRELTPLITTSAQAWHAREVRRAVARSTGIAPPRESVFLNAVLSHDGAQTLGLATTGIQDGLFRAGMARADLQDPADDQGRPVGWKVGATADTTPHVLLLLGADVEASLVEAVEILLQHLPASGFELMYRDTGHQLPGDIEHFGFRDGISHPGVRGRRDENPDSFVTRRYIPPDDPLSARFSRPGEPLIWPGQFILGYPTQDPFSEGPGQVVFPPEPWMLNGSFLVFRRLRQDVLAFRTFAAAQAERASAAFGRIVSAEEVEAWIVGRWPNGEPLSRRPSPRAASAMVSRADLELNHFDYAAAMPDVTVDVSTGRAVIAGVAGDDDGVRCPHFAHIRKVNLRDKLTDQGPSFRFRMLRRGFPYGPPFSEATAGVDRGLLFIAYHADLQPFLTSTTTWMNSETAPEGFGHDLLVGQHQLGRGAERSDAAGRRVRFEAPADLRWITPTGGGFFFSPAVSVFAGL